MTDVSAHRSPRTSRSALTQGIQLGFTIAAVVLSVLLAGAVQEAFRR
jgi:hypothetical protein